MICSPHHHSHSGFNDTGGIMKIDVNGPEDDASNSFILPRQW